MNKLFPLFISLFIVGSCKKTVTEPVYFTATTYENLGTYDTTGKPTNLEKDPVSSSLLSFVTQTLPETKDLRNTNPDLLTTKAIADISLTRKSEISITFVSHGGSALSNAVAFYTYPTNAPPASALDIKKIIYIFPNAGRGTTLRPGDKVKIGSFEPGTSVGFVLLQNAFDLTTKKLNNDAVHFCSNDVLNPELDPNLKKHAVLVNSPENKVLIGFEDLDRTTPKCDHDFNDCMIYATVTPS